MNSLTFLAIKQIVESLNSKESKELIEILNKNIIQKQTRVIKDVLLRVFQKDDLQEYIHYIEHIKRITLEDSIIRIEFGDYAIEVGTNSISIYYRVYREDFKWKKLYSKGNINKYYRLHSFGMLFQDEELRENIICHIMHGEEIKINN